MNMRPLGHESNTVPTELQLVLPYRTNCEMHKKETCGIRTNFIFCTFLAVLSVKRPVKSHSSIL